MIETIIQQVRNTEFKDLSSLLTQHSFITGSNHVLEAYNTGLFNCKYEVIKQIYLNI